MGIDKCYIVKWIGKRKRRTCHMMALLFCVHLNAQQCIPSDTALFIHFGSGKNIQAQLYSLQPPYIKVFHNCPDDGQVAFTPQSMNCFNGNWVQVPADHTPLDVKGNMLVINAAFNKGKFLKFAANKLVPGKQYFFSMWVKNIFRSSFGCTPVHPKLGFTFECNGKFIARYQSASLSPSSNPQWLQYNFPFTMPANQQAINVTLINYEEGGCGNDFTIDDIVIYACKPPAISTVAKQDKFIQTPEPRKQIPSISPMHPDNDNKRKIKSATGKQIKPKTDTPEQIPPATFKVRVDVKQPQTNILKPMITAPVLQRKTPVVQQFTLTKGIINIQLFDNGEIDGDTVTVFHNGTILAHKIPLTASPYVITVAIDSTATHHEFIMVAENSGSIPPNTSLMVVNANGKRFEIFISTSEKQNAKIIFDLKE